MAFRLPVRAIVFLAAAQMIGLVYLVVIERQANTTAAEELRFESEAQAVKIILSQN